MNSVNRLLEPVNLESTFNYVLLYDIHHYKSGELIVKDVDIEFGNNKDVAIEQGRIYNSERYPEYRNIRVVEVFTEKEVVLTQDDFDTMMGV